MTLMISDLMNERGTELFDILDSRYDLTNSSSYTQEYFHGYRYAFLAMTKSPRRYRATFGDDNLHIDEYAVSSTIRNFAYDVPGPGYLLEEEKALIRELNRQADLLESPYSRPRTAIGLVS